VKAVSESVKRLTRATETVMFVNNCLNARDSIIVIDSFKFHYEKLKKLSFSGNTLGLDGSKHLSNILPTMQSLTELRLSGCRVGDKGASSLLSTLN
jgi:Ran GTPase-activating protein (RanGAP) involved in mRNA processing and transport